MKKFAKSLVSVSALLVLAGCASTYNPYSGSRSSAEVYRAGEARQEQAVRMGVVESVRPVMIESGGSNAVGTVTGALLGGMLGSNVGGGSGRTAGAIVGAVGGGMLGNSIEGSARTRQGVEVTVRLDSGELRAFVQDVGGDRFVPGDRVRVVGSYGNARVTR